MARIILCYRVDYQGRTPVESYSRSFHREVEALGHEVLPVGEGHANKNIYTISSIVRNQYDLFIDLDCGRNQRGYLHFQNTDGNIGIPTAARFIDTHGQATMHRRLSKNYDHVFFAVWDKRDVFTNHPSAHWCPNASDLKWFNYLDFIKDYKDPKYDVGFFGSKDGLDRANILSEVCRKREWKADIREVGKTHKNRWPRTAAQMINCKVLFNKGQKHDGPNQRVIESMLCGRPLITDRDNRDGMAHLFQEGEHYLGWDSKPVLANQISWCLTNEDLAHSMAIRAYGEVISKHLIKHRVKQILEVAL